MQPRFPGSPNLPPWDLASSHSQLYEMQEMTRVILETYEVCLSQLLVEYGDNPSKRKAQEVEMASCDVRAGFSQFVAICSCFRAKSKDISQKKEVKERMEKKQEEHALLQKKAEEVLKGMRDAQELPPETGDRERRNQVKPVKELEPSLVCHFKVSGVELERWEKEMTIWSKASGFEKCEDMVASAFAAKFVDADMEEKIREVAEQEKLKLDFKTFVEQAKALCQSQSYLFTRRVEFFLMKNKDLSAKGFLEYMSKVVKEFKTAEIAAMAADAKSFAVYKCLSELPAQMRQKVVSTMTREMTFEELKEELEKLASLKTMEDAIGNKPKVTKMVQEQQQHQQQQQQQQQQERRSRPGWPAGLDPAQFGCLKCGSKDGHNARSCQVDRKDLACNFCGRQQSHVEAVCFKKLESEGKLAPRQQQQQQPQQQQQQQQSAARHPSPAGGPRSQTPGPPKLNALKLRRKTNHFLASLGGRSREVKEIKQRGVRQQQQQQQQQQRSTDEAEVQQPKVFTIKKRARHLRAADERKPRLCTIRLKKEADGLPRRLVSVWRKRRRGVEEEASQVASLCDSGSSAAVASKQMVDSLKAEVRMYTHDSIRLASTSGEELPIVGVTELWLKLKESDRFKRRIEALVVDGIDEHLILGVEQLKLLGLLSPDWPHVEVSECQEKQPAVMTLKQVEVTEEEQMQEKIDLMQDDEEDFPEGEEVPLEEGVWEMEQDEHSWLDIPNFKDMPERAQRAVEKFKDVFSNVLRKDVNWPETEIKLIPGLPELPRQPTRARRVPARFFENAWKQMQQLEAQDTVERVHGVLPADAILSTAFWVPKGGGAAPDVGRLVVDARGLNSCILRGHHPAYDPPALMRGLDPGLTCYFKADLSQSFYQLPVSEDSSKRYLNFICEFGIWRFKKIVMGISISNHVLSQCLDAKTGHLVASRRMVRDCDDYLAGGKTEEEACEVLEEFLRICYEEGITLSPKKFVFARAGRPIEWAGLEIQNGASRPDAKRIRSVLEFPEPEDLKSLKSWLALANTVGCHVGNMREKTRLQRELLKKNTAFIFSPAHREEFEKLRAEVGNPNTLFHFDSNMSLGISLDTQRTNGEGVNRLAGLGFIAFNYYRDPELAKKTGLGGPLHPKFNKVRALQFGSIAAKPSWVNKPPVVVEALGAVSCLHRLEYYCRGQTMIDLFMDSKSIVDAWTNKSLDEMAPALQELMIELSRWPIRMHFVPGKEHVVADTLGRHCVEGSEGHDKRLDKLEKKVTFPRLFGGEVNEWALEEPAREIKVMKMVEVVQKAMEGEEEEDPDGVEDLQAAAIGLGFANIFEEADKDESYKAVAQWVREGKTKADVLKAGKGNPVHLYKAEWEGLAVLQDEEGRLVLTLDNSRVVVPTGLRGKLLALAHKPHKGERLTLAFLKRYFFWKNMSQQVRDVCRSCSPCVQYSPARPKEAEVRMRVRPPRPWHTVGADFMQFHSEHLLVVVDYLTSYIWVHSFRATPNTQQTIDALDVCARTNGGYFSILATDGGPQWTSAQFEQWLTDKYIIHRQSSAHFPQSNGRIEKSVAELRTMFERAEAEKGCRLNSGEKAELVAIYNDTPRREGAASPSRLHFRRQYRHPGLPAMDLTVWEAGEEVLEWQQKERSKMSAQARVSERAKNPLRLSVGLKVLCMDKEGVYSLPGEVVGLRSQRSCWVHMEDSGRTLLRNRKFLQADPAFMKPQVYALTKSRGGNDGEDSLGQQSGGAGSAVSILRYHPQCQQSKHKKRVSFDFQEPQPSRSSAPLVTAVPMQSSGGFEQETVVGMQPPSPASSADDSLQLSDSLRQGVVYEQGQQRRRSWAQVAGTSADEEVPRLRRRIEELEEENRQLLSIWREAPVSHSREVLHNHNRTAGNQDIQEEIEEESDEDEDEVWAQESASEDTEEDPEDEDSEEGSPHEESVDRELLEQFLDTFALRVGGAVPVEVRERILSSSFLCREDQHSAQCRFCSRLSAVFPFYVRACIKPGRDEGSDLIALATYSSIPGNEIFAAFQQEFFGAVED